ncbi:NADH-quinone oxidoreductase subunit N [Dysgonomonas hofstadii]|uniref:NADH-quinone oxidoreductase subunit N n=1 Tax=Dysgonomonas hofstadii TaxID=637886 RepID=A0A840CF31_9BACT|nr:NADH-quinone oxidoreductase subunit N [Dysgonomonas hofstadii]MBB4034570.1 NADH-quinone oxidoreductase subunit N [Dysgonomonas hofstadii]
MSTLIAISVLGIISLLLDIFNLRKILVPVTLIGLIAILGMTVAEFYQGNAFIEVDKYNMIVTSGFSQGFSILFIVLAILIIAMTPKFYEEKIVKIADYVALKVFMLAGAVAMVSFGNFAMFFIGLEVLSISAYALASSEPKNLRSNEAGMKYFIMGAFASSFILFGLALIYGATGSFDITEVNYSSISQGDSLPVWFYIGFVMITVGMMFKAAIVPFHFWSPDVYEGSPTLVTAVMSTLVKVAAIGALFKVMGILSVGMTPVYMIILVVINILTLCVGNISALKQTNIKRMMAYSGISHAGFMLISFVAIGASANVILYYAAAYSLAGVAAFAVILGVCNNKKNEDIENFRGLIRKQPLLTAVMIGALLSLSGIPIFSGFFAKFFAFSQALQANYLILVIFGIINSIIAVYYYFGVINVMTAREKDEEPEPMKVAIEYKAVAAIAISLNIILGIFPSIIMGLNL